jgi:hypothetical protein
MQALQNNKVIDLGIAIGEFFKDEDNHQLGRE